MEDAPTPIGAHTLDTLCNELVSGRSVVVAEDGETLHFESRETRALLAWYLDHRDWWERVKAGDYRDYYDRMYANR